MSGLKPYTRGPDTSVLRQSIEVSKTGMRQAIHALECGSKEVVDVLLNECNLIYECKVCFNLFRSLANFISHKRTFCKNKSKTVLHHFNNPEQDKNTADKLVVVEPEPVETVFPEAGFELQDYSPSIELLKEAGILNEIEEKPLVNSLLPSNSKHSQSKLSGIVKSLIAKRNAQESEDATSQQVLLEPLTQSTRAVFQTYLLGDQSSKSMGQRYSELVKARELGSAFIGPDNRIIDPGRSTRSYSPSMLNQFNQNNSVKSKPVRPPPRPPSGRGRPPGPKCKEDEFPCTKCNCSYSRLFRTINHLKQVHDLADADVKQERRKIKRLMTKQQYPKLIVKKLSRQEISKWLKGEAADENQNQDQNDFKLLALNSVMKNVSVTLPRISPSKFPTTFVLKDEEIEIGDDTDDEVIIKPVQIHILNNGGKKRSRSSSPCSTSTSSSKEENPGNSDTANKRLCRELVLRDSPSPEKFDENRKVLGTLKNQIFEDHEEKNVTRKRGRPPKNSTKISEISEEDGVQNSTEENGDALNGRPHSR